MSNNWWNKLYMPVMEYTSYYKIIYTGLKISKIYFNWKMPVLTVQNSIYSLLPILFYSIMRYICLLLCVYIFLYFQIFYSKNIQNRKLLIFYIFWVIYTCLKLIGKATKWRKCTWEISRCFVIDCLSKRKKGMLPI